MSNRGRLAKTLNTYKLSLTSKSLSSLPTPPLFKPPSLFWPLVFVPLGFGPTGTPLLSAVLGQRDTLTDLDKLVYQLTWCRFCCQTGKVVFKHKKRLPIGTLRQQFSGDLQPEIQLEEGQTFMPFPALAPSQDTSEDSHTCPQIRFMESHHGSGIYRLFLVSFWNKTLKHSGSDDGPINWGFRAKLTLLWSLLTGIQYFICAEF